MANKTESTLYSYDRIVHTCRNRPFLSLFPARISFTSEMLSRRCVVSNRQKRFYLVAPTADVVDAMLSTDCILYATACVNCVSVFFICCCWKSSISNAYTLRRETHTHILCRHSWFIHTFLYWTNQASHLLEWCLCHVRMYLYRYIIYW